MIGNIVLMIAGIAASAYSTSKLVQGPEFDYRFAIPENQLPTLASPQSIPDVPVLSKIPIVGSLFSAQQPTDPIQGAGALPSYQPRAIDSPNGSTSQVFGLSREINPAESKLISANFHGAKAADIFAWLERQGVNFVVTDENIESKKVTMNVVRQPLSATIDSLAAALGGHWVYRGQIRVFQGGLQSDPLLWNYRELGAAPATQNQSFFNVTPTPQNPFSVKFDYNPISFPDSLTAHQKELLKSKGFLHYSDLTEEQRKMIGPNQVLKDGEEIVHTFVFNGQKIVIKNP